MPTATIFLPCEQPIVDVLTNRLSIISILDSVQPNPLPVAEDVPTQLKEARYFLAPFFIVMSWLRIEGEQGEWEQFVTLTAPDGRETELSPVTRLDFETLGERLFHQTRPVIGRLFGVSTLSLKLRRMGSEEWQTILTYPLFIEEFAVSLDEDKPQNDTSES